MKRKLVSFALLSVLALAGMLYAPVAYHAFSEGYDCEAGDDTDSNSWGCIAEDWFGRGGGIYNGSASAVGPWGANGAGAQIYFTCSVSVDLDVHAYSSGGGSTYDAYIEMYYDQDKVAWAYANTWVGPVYGADGEFLTANGCSTPSFIADTW